MVSCGKDDTDTQGGSVDELHGIVLPEFTDVTERSGLGAFQHITGAFGQKWFPESMGSGGGFIDYNGDGWQDILLVGGGSWDQSPVQDVQILWLYKNNGDGTFTLVSEETGLKEVDTYGFGVTAGDYDNDGDEDFFLATLYENMLFRNDDGVYTEVAETAGVASESHYTSCAIFFDANRDQYLDLYVGNYADWTPENDIYCTIDGDEKSYCRPDLYESIPGEYYLNNGDGTFTDMTEKAGFLTEEDDAPGNALSILDFDYNSDGWTDLAVSNDGRRNLLYENNQDGTFSEIGIVSGMAFDDEGRPRSSMGMDAGYVENDGQLSIFIGTFTGEMLGCFQHLGNGMFMDRAGVLKIARPTLPFVNMGLFLFDADLDSDLDMFISNGHVHTEIERVQEGINYLQRSQLFLNNPDGTFQDVSPRINGALAEPIAGRGAAYADYDNDGDIDILVTAADGPAYLWRNDLKQGNSLRVKLEGSTGSKDAYGSKVIAKVGDTVIQRRVKAGGSYLSHSEPIVTFGSLHDSSADSLIIEWASGALETYMNVPMNQMVQITEGSDQLNSLMTFKRLQ